MEEVLTATDRDRISKAIEGIFRIDRGSQADETISGRNSPR